MRQQEALGQQLLHDPAPLGAKRGTDGDLSLAPLGSREHQIGEVGAADQQDEADGAEQHVAASA